MIRISQQGRVATALVACLALGACKSKSKSKDAPAGAGSAGSAAASSTQGSAQPPPVTPPAGPIPALRWIDAEGELLLATGQGDQLTAACGLTGTITATEVELGPGTKQRWTTLLRDGRRFSLPKLDWVIEVAASGDVVHKRGGTDTPLGRVSNAAGAGPSDAELAWFGALVIAAPLVQHKLTLKAGDGSHELVVSGPADFGAWDVRGAGGERFASRKRDDAAPAMHGTPPAFDPTKLAVTAGDQPGTYTVAIADDALRARFPAAPYTVVEREAGALAWSPAGKPPQPLATLVGRAACKAHDRAVPVLIWALLASDRGVELAQPARKAWAK